MSLHIEALNRIREAVERQKLSHAQIAQRAAADPRTGRKLNPRTVKRLLEGETLRLATLEAVAAVVGVRIDQNALLEARVTAIVRQTMGQDRARRGNVERVGAGPVTNWEEAARLLKVSRWTLQRRRRAARDRSLPWWSSPEALFAWHEALVRRAVAAE